MVTGFKVGVTVKRQVVAGVEKVVTVVTLISELRCIRLRKMKGLFVEKHAAVVTSTFK